MARIFLDANTFIDLIENRGQITSGELEGHQLFISPLSIHILIYVTKQKIPYPILTNLISLFTVVICDTSICDKSLIGPTTDFEDNLQLHSSSEAECELFITNDKKLLSLKFFGRTRILRGLTELKRI